MRTVDISEKLQEYLDGLVPPRDPVLARMEEEAHREDIPIVDPHEGALLYLLVKIARAKRILELGTATGYSGIWLLRGTDDGTLTTFEVDHTRAERARANFAEAGFGKRAQVIEENAVSGLEKVDARFDACFIDLLNRSGQRTSRDARPSSASSAWRRAACSWRTTRCARARCSTRRTSRQGTSRSTTIGWRNIRVWRAW